jgi:hypothetical protein
VRDPPSIEDEAKEARTLEWSRGIGPLYIGRATDSIMTPAISIRFRLSVTIDDIVKLGCQTGWIISNASYFRPFLANYSRATIFSRGKI